MTTLTPQKRFLKLLAENENAVERLYRTYADKLPRYRQFWTDLANEEMRHSHIIQRLTTGSDHAFEIAVDRFDPEVFEVSRQYLTEKRQEAENERFSHEDALTIALSIETAMLERDYFKVFQGDSADLQKTLQRLAEDTAKHTEKIRQALAKHRRFEF